MVSAHVPGATVALPVAAPMAAAQRCQAAGGSVLWAKLSVPHLMELASRKDVDLAVSQLGGYIVPRFLPAFDAVATLVHVLAMLARRTHRTQRLSAWSSALPPIHIEHEEVLTPWEHKGAIMRTLVERAADRDVLLVDGVKTMDTDGWTLVVPDPEEPVTHVWAEGTSAAAARARIEEQVARLRQLMA